MAKNESFSTQQKKASLAERLWLVYFNNYLYEQGMLTESQRNRMIAKIDSRRGSADKFQCK